MRSLSFSNNRRTPEYKMWRLEVYRRDKFRCKKCGIKHQKKTKNLNAHHIYSWADYPQLRYAINNGITLCYKCHKLMYSNEDSYVTMCINLIRKPEDVVKMYKLIYEEKYKDEQNIQ
jgi:5-methylcytosine-specific restriction endonuclease McrA